MSYMAIPTLTTYFDWKTTDELVAKLAERLRTDGHSFVYGIPRGGQVVAGLLVRFGMVACDRVADATALVDDVKDSGDTERRWYEETDMETYALLTKEPDGDTGWIGFPWEPRDPTVEAHDHVTRLLEMLGQDVSSPGLKDTPRRVVAMLSDMTIGQRQNVDEILGTTFEAYSDEIVTVLGIPFYSLCEHHLVPFYGTVAIGYLPGKSHRGKKTSKYAVLGLSKLARLVRLFSRRLQLQERMTWEIANALYESRDLQPQGVGVMVRGHHLCMKMRGVQSDGEMVTSALLGEFREHKGVRAEWFALSRGDK